MTFDAAESRRKSLAWLWASCIVFGRRTIDLPTSVVIVSRRTPQATISACGGFENAAWFICFSWCVMVEISYLTQSNLRNVLQIEQQSFTFPWDEDHFVWCLRHPRRIGVVANCGGEPIGFVIYRFQKNRLCVLNLAVCPAWRRRGVGSQMMQRLVRKLPEFRIARITAKVRESNLSAQKFFQRQGFLAIRVLRNFYEDSGEDAFLMEYDAKR